VDWFGFGIYSEINAGNIPEAGKINVEKRVGYDLRTIEQMTCQRHRLKLLEILKGQQLEQLWDFNKIHIISIRLHKMKRLK
jgi:acetolactate synthase regulatory subunit